MTRLSYRRELASWVYLPLMLSGLQGGTIAIFVKKTFEDVPGVGEEQLNFAVGLVAASKAIGHLASFLWASLSHGRPKIQYIVRLQLFTALFIGLIALAPRSSWGLWMVVGLCIASWTIWSGVVTLRASVWRANYHHALRPRIAGKLATVEAVLIACAGVTIGICLDIDAGSYRWIFPCLAAVGIVGATIYRTMPFRREQKHLASERASPAKDRPNLSPFVIARVLRQDVWYRGYMTCMFLMGFGNLMLHPILAIVLTDEFDVGYRAGIGITTVIPLLTMTLAIPFWSRRLERMHVIEFRAVHVWAFVAVSLLITLGTALERIELFYCAAVVTGIGWGGGVLAWNLGHQHFAPRNRDAEYMGVHITLTGIRGTIGPLMGVLIYQWSGAETAFMVCVTMNVIGAIGFVMLARQRRAHPHPKQVRSASTTPPTPRSRAAAKV